MQVARLHDGRELRFPDGTQDWIIDATVIKILKKKPRIVQHIRNVLPNYLVQVPHARLEAKRILDKAKPKVIAQVKEKLRKIIKQEEESKKKAETVVKDLDFGMDAFGTEAFLSALDKTATDSGKNFLIEIGIPEQSILFNQVNDRAVKYVRERGAQLITDLDQASKNDIAEIIARSLEEKLSLEDIAAQLQDAYSFSAERAILIAETEVANANSYGSLAGMYELREQGVAINKVWIPDALACPVCEENGDAGAIDLDDTFPSGDLAPLAHVNCRCDLGSETE